MAASGQQFLWPPVSLPQAGETKRLGLVVLSRTAITITPSTQLDHLHFRSDEIVALFVSRGAFPLTSAPFLNLPAAGHCSVYRVPQRVDTDSYSSVLPTFLRRVGGDRLDVGEVELQLPGQAPTRIQSSNSGFWRELSGVQIVRTAKPKAYLRPGLARVSLPSGAATIRLAPDVRVQFSSPSQVVDRSKALRVSWSGVPANYARLVLVSASGGSPRMQTICLCRAAADSFILQPDLLQKLPGAPNAEPNGVLTLVTISPPQPLRSPLLDHAAVIETQTSGIAITVQP